MVSFREYLESKVRECNSNVGQERESWLYKDVLEKYNKEFLVLKNPEEGVSFLRSVYGVGDKLILDGIHEVNLVSQTSGRLYSEVRGKSDTVWSVMTVRLRPKFLKNYSIKETEKSLIDYYIVNKN